MKQLVTCIVLISALAACGGGGGSSGTIPQPAVSSVPPASSYAVRVKFQGGTSLHSTQSVRGAVIRYAHPMDVTTNGQLPIELSVQPSPGTQANDDSRTSGTATVVISPQPSPLPTVAASAAGVNVVVAPVQNAQAADQFNVTQAGIAVPSSGSFSANVAAPVNATDTIPIYVVPRASLACGDRPLYGADSQIHPADQTAAIQFVSGAAQAVSATANADLYIDGPNCSVTGFQNAAEAGVTFHAPYGALFVSSATTPYATVQPTAWANVMTSFTFASLSSGLTNPTAPTDIVLLKTQDSRIVKIAFYNSGMIGAESLAWTNFAYQEDGFSVDGF